MSKLSKADVARAAELARIALTDDQLDVKTQELGSILDFIEIMQNVDTQGITPVSQVTGLQDVWREDIVQECKIPQKELLAMTPETKDGYVVVKKVL